jgi:hypothetical protein
MTDHLRELAGEAERLAEAARVLCDRIRHAEFPGDPKASYFAFDAAAVAWSASDLLHGARAALANVFDAAGIEARRREITAVERAQAAQAEVRA